MTVGDGQFDQLNIILFLVAVFGSMLFVFVQKKVTSPLIQLTMLRNPLLSGSIVINGLVATVMMATLVVGPFYLSLALGLKDSSVGLAMSFGPILAALSGVPAGRLVDRLGASNNVIIGLLGMVIGAFALGLLPPMFGIIGYITAMTILTPCYLLFMTANNTAVMINVIADQRGVISGILSLSRNLELITGASVLGAVFSYVIGTSDITSAAPEAITRGLQITFAIAGTLVLISLGIAIWTRAIIKKL